MRSVIQRVTYAKVSTDDEICGQIKTGLFILLGVSENDTQDDVLWLTNKIYNLRIFEDETQKMNLSIADAKGEFLVVSQFTLHAKTKKGNRPSFVHAAKPEKAIPLYEAFISELEKLSQTKCQTGKFGEHMKIEICNDGPVTIVIDTKNKE
ncbi:MAG: D-aminoacyl-tRNA deacylase [Bacteroidales bacterium]|jgi:D-tyrosyl-tRNA(Tyr) deacylase|nr:D-aminoacyl-tRNA deacylase [Bacteroidales bacterium]